MKETVEVYVARILGYVAGREPTKVIEQTPLRLRELVRAATPEVTDFRPAPGKWTVREQVAHLADTEMVMTTRMRWAAAQPGQPIVAFDQEKWAEAGKYALIPIELSLDTFTAVRIWTVDFLQRLTDGERAGYVQHEERGRETLVRLVTMMAGHDLNHLRQISELMTSAAQK